MKSDEKFLDFLKDNVLDSLEKRVEAQDIEKGKRKKNKFQFVNKDAQKKQVQAQASRYDKSLMEVADEALGYIDERKTFWTAQREGLKQECQLKTKKLKKLKLACMEN